MSRPVVSPPATVVRLEEVDSTNAHALRLAEKSPGEAVAIMAERQLVGRGRRGRSWLAPESALLCSILVWPELELDDLHLVPSTLALVARDAIGDLCGGCPDLKWPNDLVVGDRKLAGILSEMADTVRGRALVVGIGVNCSLPDDFLASQGAIAEDLANRAIGCAEAFGRRVAPKDLFDVLLSHLSRRLGDLDTAKGRRLVMAEVRATCSTLGRRVRIVQVNDSFVGTAVELRDDGRLLVTTASDTRVLDAGDVVHLRPEGV